MEKIIIRVYVHRCKTADLSLQVDNRFKASFVVRSPDGNLGSELELMTSPSVAVFEELRSKSQWSNVLEAFLLTEQHLSAAAIEFINSCWLELKSKKPQLNIQ